MTLLLSESDVRGLLTMELALQCVEDSFARLADGSATLHSRQRLHVPNGSFLHYMAAMDLKAGYMGLKIYTVSGEGLRFIVLLYHAISGDLLALIEADYLGQMRTGAASGVATRLMARGDAKTIGMIGTGLQAHTQLQAIVAVRKIEHIRVFGRDAERRAKFAKEVTELLHIPVEAANSAEAAVRGADIIVTSTTASKPVVEGRWLSPGVHMNAIGANWAQKRELDTDAVLRADIIAVDSCAQSKLESGDLIQAFEGHSDRWGSVVEVADIAGRKVSGRTKPEQITLFKSNGIAIQDVVTAGRIYELAKARGIGRDIPLWEHLRGH
jgi:ornithine cyclodeaminase/alanine dehydrogenase-like protein (mu-crystallin family)